MEQSTNRFMSKLSNSVKAMLFDDRKRNTALLVGLIILVLYTYTDIMRFSSWHYKSTLKAIGVTHGVVIDEYNGGILRKMTEDEIKNSIRGELTPDEEVVRSRNRHWRLYDWSKHWFRPFG